jgi:hypothetical protein
MDDIFRLHDIAYAESISIRTMRWADAACVEALARLDARTLSPDALEFRERSSEFFSNPRIAWIGKPVSSIVRTTEDPACPLQNENDVRRLFGLEDKPDAASGKRPSGSTELLLQRLARNNRQHEHGTRKPREIIAGVEKKLSRLRQLAMRQARRLPVHFTAAG